MIPGQSFATETLMRLLFRALLTQLRKTQSIA